MGWDKDGRYYTRSRRENGRVVREYIGGGPAGEMIARHDAIERGTRAAARAVERADREGAEALDAPLNELSERADLLVRAVLVAAGFHQHKRGEWRKKRG